MYTKPTVERFGSFRDLTQAGCTGASDNLSIAGIGTSVGNAPGSTAVYCFNPSSR